MNATVRKLNVQDIDQFIDLIQVFEQTFELTDYQLPSRDHLLQLLAQEPFWVFVAEVDNQVIGGLTAYVLPQYYVVQPQVYLYDIAIREACQRQGIGRQLLTSLKRYCQLIGASMMFVQADGDDIDAINFYRATGGSAAPVVHFTYMIDR